MMFDMSFKADVIIYYKKKALDKVGKSQPGLVVCIDGSKLDQGQAVTAIYWQDKLSKD